MFVVILVNGKRYQARHSQQIDAVSNGWTVIDDIGDDDRWLERGVPERTCTVESEIGVDKFDRTEMRDHRVAGFLTDFIAGIESF